MAGLSTLSDKDRVQWMHHEVRKGDTLFNIARRYGVTVEAVTSSNKLKGPLRVGQDLLLPMSAAARAARPMTAAAPTAANPMRVVTKTNQPIVHKVRAGETLTSIARRYNVMVQQLTEWNAMQANEVLRLGRRLKIWTHEGPQA